MEIRMLDEFESARMQGVEVDPETGGLKIKCDCGLRGKCSGKMSIKAFTKFTGWKYFHNGPGWICPVCAKKNNSKIEVLS